MRKSTNRIDREIVWNIFPNGHFGRFIATPPFIGTRMVRINMRYTDEPMRTFAKASLTRLRVSGV